MFHGEVVVTEQEQNFETRSLAQRVQAAVGVKLDLSRDVNDEDIIDVITGVVFEFSRQRYLSLGEKHELINRVFNSMRRLDIIQPLLEDGSVTEIMINAPDEIFIERDGRLHQLDLRFDSLQKLENIIQSIVSQVNREVNEASPIVDARLPDGSRVNVVLPPVALKGPTLTIRKFPRDPLTIDDLVAAGSLTREAADWLHTLVRARYNIFVCGGTGSGKTTFLNVLSGMIPGGERIVTIEDSAELRLESIANLVSLETRNINTEGRGAVTIRDLIRTSLRMRPDRIIVGEVRGPEALDMLQAMNTGHDGSLSTGHANSTRDMFSRLETMVLTAAPLPVEVIRKQIAAALDIIIYLERFRDGSRRVREMTEVVGFAGGEIELNPLFVFEEEEAGEGRVAGSLGRTGNHLVRTRKCKTAGISPS